MPLDLCYTGDISDLPDLGYEYLPDDCSYVKGDIYVHNYANNMLHIIGWNVFLDRHILKFILDNRYKDKSFWDSGNGNYNSPDFLDFYLEKKMADRSFFDDGFCIKIKANRVICR